MMTLFTLWFYLIAALIVAATAMAITRRHMVHAVLYLVLSFFGTAMLFYLLGAPLLAALEIIIYAGAIMVLFLFIIIMIQTGRPTAAVFAPGQLAPAVLIGIALLAAFAAMAGGHGAAMAILTPARALPKAFGIYLFQHHWLAIEIASTLLLVALMGALYLGRRAGGRARQDREAS